MSYIRSEYKKIENATSGGSCIEIWNKNRYVRNTKQHATVRATTRGLVDDGFSIEFGGGVHWTHSLKGVRTISDLRDLCTTLSSPSILRLKISPLTYEVNLGQVDSIVGPSSGILTINSSETFDAPFTINMAGSETNLAAQTWPPDKGEWLLQANWDGASVLTVRGGYRHYDSDRDYGSLSAGVFMDDFHFFTQ